MMVLRILFGKLTIFTACGLTSGGLAYLLSGFLRLDPWWSFAAGSFLPLGPLTWYFSSPQFMRRSIEGWKKLKEDGLITEQQYKELRAAAVNSQKEKLFGQSAQARIDRRDA